jgi:hypothetical protein
MGTRFWRVVRTVAVLALTFGVSGASPLDAGRPGLPRVSLCGARLAALDPAEYLPNELSTVHLLECPEGTVSCQPACCRCCDRAKEVCCVTTGTPTCTAGDRCPHCP